jgi:hypothetical protein
MNPELQKLLAMNTALTAALQVALAAHPDREHVIQALQSVSEQTATHLLNSGLQDSAADAANMVFAGLIQSLRNDAPPS